MEFGVLGPLEVRRDGVPVPVRGTTQTLILQVLLAYAGKRVSTSKLVDALWPEDPPANAVRSLRSYVAKLRRSLGEPDRIVWDITGYRIRLGPEELDARTFFDAVQTAKRERARGALESAFAQLQRAGALWRGQPYEGAHENPLLIGEVRRLNELRLQALEDQAEVGLDLRRHDELLTWLPALLDEHPERERLAGHLMLALYRGDRSAEALEVYRRTRTTLVEEHGIEPSAWLEDLHGRMLRSEVEPRSPRAPVAAPPGGSVSDPRDGPTKENDLVGDLFGGRPVFRSWWDPPLTTAGFIGRRDALAALASDASSTSEAGSLADTGAVRLVSSVDGVGGVGKTALAVAYADQVAERFPDGRVFLDFRSYSQEGPPLSGEQALRTVLERTLPSLTKQEINTLDVGRLRALWREAVEGRRVLMVWDNVAEPAQIEPLLIRQPDCMTIVTSRTALDLPQCRRLSLDVMAADDAITLFSAIAGPDHAADRDLVTRLVAADGYMPVLIEQHAKTLSVAGTLTTTAEAVHELETLPSGRTRQALYARLEWSYRRLTSKQQFAFRVLGAHPARILTAGTAAAVLDCDVDQAVDLLNALITAGMAHRHRHSEAADVAATSHSVGRGFYGYTAHDLVLDYAADLVVQNTAEHQSLRAALLDYYQRRLDGFADTDDDLAWLTVEHSHIAAAALHGHDAADAQLASALGNVLLDTSRYVIADAVFHHAAQVSQSLDDPQGYAEALWGIGESASRQCRYQEAERPLRQAADAYQALEDQRGHARAITSLGRIVMILGQFKEAEALSRQAADIFWSHGDIGGYASALTTLGDWARLLGRYPEARSCLRRASGIFDDLGDRRGLAWAMWGIADVALMQGHYREAEKLAQQAADTFEASGERSGQTRAMVIWGGAAMALGRLDDAEVLQRQALGICRALGDRAYYLNAISNLAKVSRARGRLEEAENLIRQVADAVEGSGDRRGYANVTLELATVMRERGRLEEADALCRQALGTHVALGVLHGQYRAVRGLGEVALARGRYDEAESLFQQSVGIAQDLEDRTGYASVLRGLGEISRRQGRLEEAEARFQEAGDIFEESGELRKYAMVLEGLAEVEWDRGRVGEARGLLERALRIYTDIGIPDADRVRARMHDLDQTEGSSRDE